MHGQTNQSSAQAEPAPNEWQGLVPLRSTRADVERLLGSPSMSRGFVDIYKSEAVRVDVRYSKGPCELSPVEEWNVAKDVVILMEVTPQRKISIKSLRLDPSKYVREQESHPEHWVRYLNRDGGVIVHSFRQGKNEYVRFFEFSPSAKDKALRCVTDRVRQERRTSAWSGPESKCSTTRTFDAFVSRPLKRGVSCVVVT